MNFSICKICQLTEIILRIKKELVNTKVFHELPMPYAKVASYDVQRRLKGKMSSVWGLRYREWFPLFELTAQDPGT